MKRLGCLVGLLWITTTWAQSPAVGFLTLLNQIKTMQAHYTQVVSTSARQTSKTSGEMALAKPGRFRWLTQFPATQLIVADGKKIWVYDVDLEQVTVRKQTSETSSVVGLLLNADAEHLTRMFDVTESSRKGKRIFILSARSKQAELNKLLFHFEAGQLVGMELFDGLNQHTVVRFQRIVLNKMLPPQQFQFAPPPGIDVVNGEDSGE